MKQRGLSFRGGNGLGVLTHSKEMDQGAGAQRVRQGEGSRGEQGLTGSREAEGGGRRRTVRS